MYEIIADQYSKLFPPDENRSRFILEEIAQAPDTDLSILDAGCATGDLAFELSVSGCRVSGIDIDKTMIDIARKKAKTAENPPTFTTCSLTDIQSLGHFNAIVCFGNTLPHLPDEASVFDFFNKASKTVYEGGRLIFQIINFDQLKNSKHYSFPDIDTGDSIFKRSYDRRNDNRLDFKISVKNKQTGKELTDQTPLLPLMRKRLIGLLEDSGFTDVKIYSDYNRAPAGGMEFASIYTAARAKQLK